MQDYISEICDVHIVLHIFLSARVRNMYCAYCLPRRVFDSCHEHTHALVLPSFLLLLWNSLKKASRRSIYLAASPIKNRRLRIFSMNNMQYTYLHIACIIRGGMPRKPQVRGTDCSWRVSFVFFLLLFLAVWGKEIREPYYDGYSGLG